MPKLTRRNFFKTGGAVGSALSLAGIAGAGYQAGKDTSTYTGWDRHMLGDGQFFNREPFRVDHPTYEKIGPTRRIEGYEHQFTRKSAVSRALRAKKLSYPEDNVKLSDVKDVMPPDILNYFHENEGRFEEILKAIKMGKIQKKNWEKFKDTYSLADAWDKAHGGLLGSFPKSPNAEPEVWDFMNCRKPAVEFKSPKHASELIKKITHTFGATLVGVTKLNPDWVYQGKLRGLGKGNFEVPKHWKYAIAFAVPHEWDAMYANPTYGTSFDGYSRLRVIGGKLEIFIRRLGYSSRAHVPPGSYDLITVPIAIDAGLGEQGRCGFMISPELGANTRLGVVTTDLELEPDKPIDIGVSDFCKKCKICAEQCPSNAISYSDEPETVVRGYKRWLINHEKCYTIWNTVATSHSRGCRVCIAVCPYSRKNNWIHTIARETDARDKTGLVSSMLLAMQKGLFKYPKVNEYLPSPEGNNSTLHPPPDWLNAEKWTKKA